MAVDKKSCGFTLNLLSNASIEIFPGNRLSTLTTLLPEPLHLPGEQQVALVELSGPALTRNATDREITVSKRLFTPQDSTPQNLSQSTRLVSMIVPREFWSSTMQFTAPERNQFKTVDSIMKIP